MKILFLHTYYLQKGGEDAVYEQDYNLLGEDIPTTHLNFHNKSGWRGALQFFCSIWNPLAGKILKKKILQEKPTIIHMHNLHFAIGPIAIHVAKKAGIPVVLTLHNFRLLDPSGILLETDQTPTSLKKSFPWKAVRKRVYRNSLLQTFWLAFIVWFHKKIGTWQMVDRFIVQTDFSKKIFVDSSLQIASERFLVNPNFVQPPILHPTDKENHFLFIGRLSKEKGIDILLETFNDSNHQLQIGGDGPMKERVSQFCVNHKRAEYLGRLDKDGVQRAMEKCSALVFPSIWFEGMPMTILEAFALGVPVIASNAGAMSVMIKHGYNGLLFDMGDPQALSNQINYWDSLGIEEKNEFSLNARKEFDEKYSPEIYKSKLEGIYQSTLAQLDYVTSN